MPSLQGKVVLVTGGARRVGAAIARCLHAEGMSLVIHYRHSEREALALKEDLERTRPESVRLVMGALGADAVARQIIRDAIAAFGRLDALVNNASAFYPTPLGQVTENEWEDLMASNLKAPFFLAQAASAELRARKGCIVNLVDIHAERPLKNYPVYSIAKAGLAMMTWSMARELAPEVRVNGVAPGTILWPERAVDEVIKGEILARVPQKREGSPEDLAQAVRFFLRDAPYVSGQILAVDGGRSVVP
ncbi:MAG: pteridine reductase [Acidiferrobacteraceae bacterium]